MPSPGRRPTPLVTIAAVLTLVVAACGSNGPTPIRSAAPTATPAATSAPTVEPTVNPVPTASPIPPAATPPGVRTGRVEVTDAGFAITLAEGWIALPLDAGDLKAILDALPPELGLEGQLPALLAAGVKLWAVDASIGYGSNLTVFAQPAAIPVSLLRSFAEAGLATVPGIQGEPVIEDATIDGVEGIRVTYELLEPGSGVTVGGTQIYLATESSLFVFTFTTASGTDDAIEAMIGSIELL